MSEIEKMKQEIEELKQDLELCKERGLTISNQLAASLRERNTDIKNLTQKIKEYENEQNQLKKELDYYKTRCADLEVELVSQKS